MLNFIWAAMILLATVFSIASGRFSELSNAMIQGAQKSIEVFLILIAMLILWGGLMNIAEKSGMTSFISRLLNPLISWLFPNEKNDKKARGAIAMNIAANMLGLGNAATPFGLKAVKLISDKSQNADTASDSMIMFVILNTVSLQLIPTGAIALRASMGSNDPAAIIPAVLCASLTSAVFVIVTVKLLFLLNNRKGRMYE